MNDLIGSHSIQGLHRHNLWRRWMLNWGCKCLASTQFVRLLQSYRHNTPALLEIGMNGPAGRHSGQDQHLNRQNCYWNLCLDCMCLLDMVFEMRRLSNQHSFPEMLWSERFDLNYSRSVQDRHPNKQNCCWMLSLGCMNPESMLFDLQMRGCLRNIPVMHRCKMIELS